MINKSGGIQERVPKIVYQLHIQSENEQGLRLVQGCAFEFGL